MKKGYTFYSDTDTEVAVKLIDYYYKKNEQDPLHALTEAMTHFRGSYALAVMYQDFPDEIYVARKDSPMIIAITDKACYIASDVPAILNHTRSVFYRQRRWFLYRKRSGLRHVHHGWSGDRSCHYKSLQHTADRSLSAGIKICIQP